MTPNLDLALFDVTLPSGRFGASWGIFVDHCVSTLLASPEQQQRSQHPWGMLYWTMHSCIYPSIGSFIYASVYSIHACIYPWPLCPPIRRRSSSRWISLLSSTKCSRTRGTWSGSKPWARLRSSLSSTTVRLAVIDCLISRGGSRHSGATLMFTHSMLDAVNLHWHHLVYGMTGVTLYPHLWKSPGNDRVFNVSPLLATIICNFGDQVYYAFLYFCEQTCRIESRWQMSVSHIRAHHLDTIISILIFPSQTGRWRT